MYTKADSTFLQETIHAPEARVPIGECIEYRRNALYKSGRLTIGVGRANAPPPSEPDRQFSRVRLSS